MKSLREGELWDVVLLGERLIVAPIWVGERSVRIMSEKDSL